MEKKNVSNESGFTLVEVLGAIVVGSIIFGFAAFAIRGGLASAKVSNAQENLSYLRVNIQEVYAHVRNYETISNEELIGANAVPQGMVIDDQIVNDWNGAITVEPADDGRSYTITFEDVPQDACIKLGSQRDMWDSLTIGGAEVDRGTVVTSDLCNDEFSNTLVFEAH